MSEQRKERNMIISGREYGFSVEGITDAFDEVNQLDTEASWKLVDAKRLIESNGRALILGRAPNLGDIAIGHFEYEIYHALYSGANHYRNQTDHFSCVLRRVEAVLDEVSKHYYAGGLLTEVDFSNV